MEGEMVNDTLGPLRQFPFFSRLSTKALKKISRIVEEVALPKGTVIVEQGTVGYEFLLIEDGAVRVEKDGEVVNRLFSNDFFGEIAMIGMKPHSATVVAETDVKLLVVGRWHFEHLLEMTPGLWKEFATVLCGYVRSQ